MSKDAFKERERALEEAFFHKVDAQLLHNLRSELADESEREKLAKATGFADESLLQELIDDGISAESIAAVSLIPLVLVAWADGSVSNEERSAVQKASHEQGIEEESAAGKLLTAWLQTKPEAHLFESWKHYVQATTESMPETSKDSFRESVVGRARTVAKASGGILGINAISVGEQKVLDELAAALG